MKKNVLVTGGSGTIASIIFRELKDEFSFIFLDCAIPHQIGKKVFLLEVAYDYDGLKQHIQGKDAVVHLAWDSKENWRTGIVEPKNKTAVENVYRVAVETGVKRVIMASSIHADARFYESQTPFGLSPNQKSPVPDSPYGASKLYIESLGRYYATKHGLEVICIRFGGVTLDDVLRPEPMAEKIWLHTKDCASLVKACIDTSLVPGNFCIIHGISHNTGRVHDLSNPFDWVPKHDFAK